MHIHTRPPYDTHVPYPVSLLTASLVIGIPGTGVGDALQELYSIPVFFVQSCCRAGQAAGELHKIRIVGRGRGIT